MAGLVENKEKIEKLAKELAEKAGLLLVDLEVKDGGSNRSLLRLYVDKKGGVTIPECSQLNRDIGDLLDEDDSIDSAYRLEVSSPGVERPFIHRIQYTWSIGRKVHVLLMEKIEKQFVYEGELSAVSDSTITLQYGKGKVQEIPFDNIKEAYQMVAFGKR